MRALGTARCNVPPRCGRPQGCGIPLPNQPDFVQQLAQHFLDLFVAIRRKPVTPVERVRSRIGLRNPQVRRPRVYGRVEELLADPGAVERVQQVNRVQLMGRRLVAVTVRAAARETDNFTVDHCGDKAVVRTLGRVSPP